MRKLDVAVAAAVVAATAAATVVLPTLDDDRPVEVPALSGEVVEIHPDELDRGSVVALDSGEPLACMFELDCLMQQVEGATGVGASATVDTAPTDTLPADFLPPAT